MSEKMSEKKPEKKPGRKFLFPALAAILIIAGGFGLYKVATVFQGSLAAPMVLDIQSSPTYTLQALPTDIRSGSTSVSTPAPTLQAETCGKSGVMTILLLARDMSKGDWPYGADLIRFVRVDFSNKTIRIIAVPRDLWVETPHLDYLNLKNSRLGLVYYQVEKNSQGSVTEIATASTTAVAQALYDNYSVTADHYMFFEMQYFADAIDQIGGLDINIPTDVSLGNAHFYAGQQHLDGYNTLLYARILPGNELSDGWNRMDRQNLVLKALIAKLLEPANIGKVPALFNQFSRNITMDLSPALITSLVCMVDKVPQDQITTVQVSRDMILSEGPDSSMIADTEKVKAFLQEQLAP